MKSAKKINILGWIIIVMGIAVILMSTDDKNYAFRDCLIGIVWMLGGMGVLLRNNVVRKIIIFFCLIGIWMIPLAGVINTFIMIKILNSGGMDIYWSIFQMIIILITEWLFFFFVYRFFKKNDDIAREFDKNYINLEKTKT